MTKTYQKIKFTKSDNIAEIILNNPPVNIMTQVMMEEINSVLEDLIADDQLHLLIFRAEGKHFSAGADVAEHTKEKCPEMIPEFMKIFSQLNNINCPTIAVVQGMALGGGCELATYCDMVFASDKAKFGQPEISVGVFPPVAAVIFPRLIGRNKALELLLSGDIIPAAEAEKIGLINKVFPEESFSQNVEENIKKFTDKSSIVLKITKKTLDLGLHLSFNQALGAAELAYLQQLMKTRDANEGIKAFLEKRPPVWTGK